MLAGQIALNSSIGSLMEQMLLGGYKTPTSKLPSSLSILGIQIMPRVIDPVSVVTRHLVKAPPPLERRRAILHSKGKVSQDKLADLSRSIPGAKKSDANLPAQVKPTLTSMRSVEPTGTCIPIMTKDAAKPEPDFLQGGRALGLTPEEMNECMAAPPTRNALGEYGEIFNQIAMQAVQKEKRKEESEARLKKQGQAQREQSGKVSRHKSGTKASQFAPDKAPPSYAEFMGVPSAPKAFSLNLINMLPANPDPVEHRQQLLALARNVAGQLQGAPADTKLSATRDICYAMIRELKKREPDLSQSACGWLVARGKELAGPKSK